uniref:BSD domain-containing protein n=1 Tax=Sphaeramia orbicularis TaxID=375764 RepID=A0A673C6S9_9TELE
MFSFLVFSIACLVSNCYCISCPCVFDNREGWWGGWLQQSFQAVKEKSSEALEFIKRDLTEFSTVVQHDTACSIVATATAVRNKLAVEGSSETTEKVKKSLSGFLGVITDTLAPPPDKTIDCDVITLVATPAGTTEVYDSSKARLYSLQADPATYCNEPDGPPEQFDNWLSGFSLEDKKGEISELLVNSPSIRALYTKMVPAAVAHSEFWQRYFYKVFQLDQVNNMLFSVHYLFLFKLAKKLTEASLEDVKKTQEEQTPANNDSPPESPTETVAQPQVTVEAPTPTLKPEATKEEGPQDLRVFELNSDSGKSTPSNNGKKGSSTDVSEDWEKDFDLDMTEEEVQLALSKIDASGELDEDWENWD